MKKLISLFTLSLCFLLSAMSVNAQVTVSGAIVGNGSYTTLKAAFDTINTGAQTGATILIDITASTVEPLMARLNANDWASVRIAPTVPVTVTGSDTVTIKLAGADRVTIDGTIGGVGRNLSVLNTSSLANATAIWLAHGAFVASDSAGARNNTIRNCEVACGVAQNGSTTVTFGINLGGTLKGNVSGRNNDSNRIIENRVIKCRMGININGGTALNLNDDNLILNNIVGPTSFGADEIGGTGIYVQFQTRCIIEKNLVQFVGGNLANTTVGADRVGIALGTNAWTSTSTTTTTGSDNIVRQNIVHDIIEERTFSAVGILAGTTLGTTGLKTNNLIVNNVVYNVRSNSTPGDQCVGIGHSGGSGDRIVFNSISLTGDLDPAGTTTASTNPICAGISKHLAAAGDTAVFIKDNAILVDANTNTTTLIKACIIGPLVGYAFGSGGIDYNDYWIPDTLTGKKTGVAGTGTVSFTTLAQWQTAYTPGQDVSSIQCDPMYINPTSNLQPAIGSCLVGAGTPIAGIVDDILKVARNVTNPTIGAYEVAIAPPIDVGVISATFGTSPLQIISVGKGYNIVATVKNFGPPVTVDSVFYTVNGGSPVGPVSVGLLPTNGTAPATFTGGNAFIPTIAGINTIRIFTSLAADLLKGNDTLTILINVQQKIAVFPHLQNFTNPVNWTVVVENAVGTTGLWGLGICTNPDGKTPDTAATANCFTGSALRREILRSPEMDISSLSNPVVHFYTAYKSFLPPEDDTLEVVVSTDGGVTFFSASTVYNKSRFSTPSLATRPDTASAYFPNTSRQWRHETIDLANVSGSSNLVIGFRAKSDFGNRIWVDNVIVTGSSDYCDTLVTLPGPHSCNSLISIDFVTVGLRPEGNSNESRETVNATKSDKLDDNTNILPGFTYAEGQGVDMQNNNKIQTGNNVRNDNPAGGLLGITTHLSNDPPSVATPEIALNTTATNPSGGISQPNVIYQDYWFTVTYTGNDFLGYANYNVLLDVTTFTNTDSLYIMKRTDMTGSWVALNTTIVGSNAVATFVANPSLLSKFSDFVLGGDSITQPLPVELSSFTSTVDRRDVNLTWTTASEVNNSGFDIERAVENSSWLKVGNVAGNGTTTSPMNYSFSDRNLASGKYNYRLKQIDFNGNFTYYDLSNEVIVGVPTKFDLSQNYPNPFNPSTKINYDLPFDSKVSIKLFDMSGREVATLVNEVKIAGYYTAAFNASNLASGVYFYRISADANGQNFVSTKKMMLIK